MVAMYVRAAKRLLSFLYLTDRDHGNWHSLTTVGLDMVHSLLCNIHTENGFSFALNHEVKGAESDVPCSSSSVSRKHDDRVVVVDVVHGP